MIKRIIGIFLALFVIVFGEEVGVITAKIGYYPDISSMTFNLFKDGLKLSQKKTILTKKESEIFAAANKKFDYEYHLNP